MGLTSRQRILAAYYPSSKGEFEVKNAKIAARGHYWVDTYQGFYCAFTKKGKRRFFSYYKASSNGVNQKEYAKTLARKWSKL